MRKSFFGAMISFCSKGITGAALAKLISSCKMVRHWYSSRYVWYSEAFGARRAANFREAEKIVMWARTI